MKNINLSELLKTANLKRIVALMMAILMLVCMVGCKNDGDDNSSTLSSSQQGASSNTSSEDTSSDDTSSDETSSNVSTEDTTSSEITNVTSNSTTNKKPAKVDPLAGNINVEYEFLSGTSRSDADEIQPAVDPAPFLRGYEGYAQKERDERLQEILNTKNTLEYYDIKGKIYYVSTKGNDANDGTSPENAIQTLAAVDGLPLEDGDAVLFERGCIWRMSQQFACREGVTYGSYGEGRKPIILGSPKNFAQEVWSPSKKKNVWQISYMYEYPCGAFFDEGKEAGYQKLTMRELEKNTDYFLDEENATLYVYCDKGNPSKVYKSIEFSQDTMTMHLGTGVDRVTIDNIIIRYMGPGGVYCSYNNEALVVTNCEVGFTGGTWMGSVRGGNGISTWCGGLNMKWDHNWIYQTFDSGVSPQGRLGQHNYDNISISYNLFEYNNCDIESFESGYSVGMPLSTYSNNHYDYNICRFTSLGWGTRADDGGIRGIDGVHRGSFGADQIIDITSNYNIIDCPGRYVYNMSLGNKACFDNWERKGNVYYIKQSMRTLSQLTAKFYWSDEETRVDAQTATSKSGTIDAFALFEPDATVYWYK